MASTFLQLRAVNETRAQRWHGVDSVPWTGADWSNAMCGEAGEVANAVKKIRRIETRVSSNNPTQPQDFQHGRDAIAKEIGDTIIYLDLLAAHYGIALGEAICSAFNQISAREGFSETLLLLPDGGYFTEKRTTQTADDRDKRIELQSQEFKAVGELARRYNSLPPIVDDGYPEARHYYESAMRSLVDAIRANGRLDDLLHA